MEKKEGDEFVVDDLFDFSKGEFEDEFLQNVENEKEDKNYCVPVGNEVKTEDEGFVSGSSGELCIPVDDVADLEWLSHFVEDSFSGYSVPFLVKSTEAVEKAVREIPDQTKVRRHWKKIDITKDIDGCKAHQALCCSLCGAQKTTKWHAGPMGPKTLCNACGVRHQPVRETLDQTKVRRHKKNLGIAIDTAGCGSYQAPQCSHCGVQDTPQWRAGPMGPKTLCNACGVRHKSGRLLPEYRPACSPTFSSEVHSNSHRKVLEIRRKKEEGPVYVSQDLDF